MTGLVSAERIEIIIYLVRGYKVILDSDLAILYEVEVKQLKRQVRRNRDRFPSDFMFELSKQEYQSLRRHFGALKRGEHSKYPPYAFTEQGVAMLSSVLNSKLAVQVNIEIMRAFVQLRQLLTSNTQLARKLDALEKKYDAQFKVVFDAIRQLMAPPRSKTRRIGFLAKERAASYGGRRRNSSTSRRSRRTLRRMQRTQALDIAAKTTNRLVAAWKNVDRIA